MTQEHKHSENEAEHGHHHHGIGGGHAPKTFGKAFAIGVVLNFSFVVIEAGYGYVSNSLSLMADAGHNLSDVFGLILAWGAIWLGTRKPNKIYTYGLGQTSVLAALVNAVLLIFAVGAICWEAIGRLQHPEPIVGSTVIIVAAVGILINGATAFLFMSGSKSDINIRGAYLHMAADAAVSLGVVIAGFAIKYTGWLWLDPLVSIGIGFVIIYGTWELLRESFRLAISAVPSSVQTEKVKNYLMSLKNVTSVHDFHIWAMSTTQNAMTAHLVVPSGHPGDSFIWEVGHELQCKYQIHHATLQIELGDTAKPCPLASDDVV